MSLLVGGQRGLAFILLTERKQGNRISRLCEVSARTLALAQDGAVWQCVPRALLQRSVRHGPRAV
jgi:hypothetical protein